MEGHIYQADAIVQNLKDAGCNPDIIERFMYLQAGGETEEGFRLLSKQRRRLLDTIHENQKMLDNLDYLIYKLRKER